MAARGIRRVIELAIDAASARRMKVDAQRALDAATDPSKADRNIRAIDRGMESLRGTALKLGAALGSAFGALQLGRFLVDSVRAFQEADKIWNRLAGTLESVGVRYASVKKDIQAAAQDLERSSTFDDEAFAQALTVLVSVSGDYAKSLRNVQVAADLAAAKQIDIETAAELVGKAMVGQTGTLARYGIVVKSTDDAVEVMRKRFAGMAENELHTTAGRVQQLANFWSDLQEAIGEGVATSPAVTGFLDDMSRGAADASSRFGDLTDQVGSFIDTLFSMRRVIEEAGGWSNVLLNPNFMGRLKDGFDAVREMSRQQRAALREIGELSRPEALNARERSILGQRADAIRTGSLSGTGLARQVADFDAQLRAVQAQRDALAHPRGNGGGGNRTGGSSSRPQRSDPLRARVGDVFVGDFNRGTLTEQDRMLGDLGPSAQQRLGLMLEGKQRRGADKAEGEAALDHFRDQWLQDHAEMVNAAQDAAQRIGDVWASVFEQLITGGSNVGEAFVGIGKGMAAALLSGVQDLARSKAAENIARAVEMFAMSFGFTALGSVPSAAAARKAGLGHLAAAAKWTLFGAVAGAAGGALGGGGGGGGGSVNRGATGYDDRSVDKARMMGPEIHIYVDGVDPKNPRHQALVLGAVQGAQERYGPNGKVTIHPRGAA